MAKNILTYSFTATGESDTIHVHGYFNVSIQGIVGSTIYVERSFDKGVTWQIVETATEDFSRIGLEPESHTLYRFRCGVYGSGTVTCRMSSPGRY